MTNSIDEFVGGMPAFKSIFFFFFFVLVRLCQLYDDSNILMFSFERFFLFQNRSNVRSDSQTSSLSVSFD